MNIARTRPPSEPYKLKMSALEVVGSTQRRVAAWTPRVAYLRSLVEFGIAESARAEHRREMEAMRREIGTACAELAAKLETLPREVVVHSRVVDAQRSLASLEDTLSRALAQLSPRDATGRG